MTFSGPDGPVDLTIAGILAGDGPVVGTGGRTVILPLATMQRLFADDTVSRVDVIAGEGATPAEAADAIGVALTSQPYVLSSPGDVARSLRSSTADFRSTTALIAAVALFVGAFLIFNTLSMTVTERIRELGLLRAAGATRGQLDRVRPDPGGGAGRPRRGPGAGRRVRPRRADGRSSCGRSRRSRSSGSTRAPVRRGRRPIGLAVTIAAAIEPARRAGSSRRSRPSATGPNPAAPRRARLRWLVAVFVAVGSPGSWSGRGTPVRRGSPVGARLPRAPRRRPRRAVGPGALGRLAGLPFRRAFRLEERLARAAIVRDRSRTTLTVGALAIGLAMVVAVGGVAHQSRLAASAWLAEVIPGDELLTSIRPVALDEDVIARARGERGVDAGQPDRDLRGRPERRPPRRGGGASARICSRTAACGSSPANGSRALSGLDAGGTAILPRAVAERTGLAVGSTLTLAVGGGSVVDLQVAGVVERTLPGTVGEAVLVGWPDATAVFGVEGADVLAVRYDARRRGDRRGRRSIGSPASRPSSRRRSPGSPARSTTRSARSSACSTPSRSWPSSSRRSGSSTR